MSISAGGPQLLGHLADRGAALAGLPRPDVRLEGEQTNVIHHVVPAAGDLGRVAPEATGDLELAARVGPGGHVLGPDISNQSVARARQRIAAAELRHAEVIVTDVSCHAFAPNTFDLVFSRFGVMFRGPPSQMCGARVGAWR